MGRTFMTNGEDDWNCRGYRGQKRQTIQEGKMRKTVKNKSQVWVINLKTPYRFVS